MSDKLQQLIDQMMKELGFDFPEDIVSKVRKMKIVVVNDETGEVEEVAREACDDGEGANIE